MRTEIRKVTVEHKVYIAEDGKVFDNEDSCELYEMQLLEKRFKMYDIDVSEVSDIESCFYVKLDTQEDVDAFKTCGDYNDMIIAGLQGPGVYFYNENDYEWINLTKIMSKLEAKNELQSI